MAPVYVQLDCVNLPSYTGAIVYLGRLAVEMNFLKKVGFSC